MKKVLAAGVGAGVALALAPHVGTAAPARRDLRSATGIVLAVDGVRSGSVRIKGRHFSTTVRATRTIQLAPGRYRLRATSVVRGGAKYLPSPRTMRVNVRAGRTALISVNYAALTRQAAWADPPPGGELGSVFALLNQARARGVRCDSQWMPPAPPVTYDDGLADAAQRHSQDMADKDYFSHDSLDGRSFVDRIRATEYTGDPGGENIASGFQHAQEVMQGWLDSPGHCRNLMNPEFDNVGLGLASRIDTRYTIPVTYWVQDFGYEKQSYKY